MRSWAKHMQRRTNTSYRLTLELSGGAAVRLNEMLDGCDATCSGDDVSPRRAHSLSYRLPKTTSSESRRLAGTPRKKAAEAKHCKPPRSWAKHTTPRTTTSYRLTLELSGGAAVRLNEMLDGCDDARLGEAVGLGKRKTMSNRPPNYQL